jgi:hypothetical protein
VKIVQDLPLIFADGVTSHYYATGITKFYLSRLDPDPHASGPPKLINLAQIVMTADGFAQMVTFFQRRLEIMIKENIFTPEQVADIRRLQTEAYDVAKRQP